MDDFTNVQPSAELQLLYSELVSVIDDYTGKVDRLYVLATCAQITGKLLATLDDRRINRVDALETIQENITHGYERQTAWAAKQTAGRA
jgi:hypothetical protein